MVTKGLEVAEYLTQEVHVLHPIQTLGKQDALVEQYPDKQIYKPVSPAARELNNCPTDLLFQPPFNEISHVEFTRDINQ